jgi:hypothetical protein
MLPILAAISIGQVVFPQGEFLALARLTAFDREMAGLVDAYLEAVPECPPRIDTPVRLWEMDISIIRARLARAHLFPLTGFLPDIETRLAFKHYLYASDRYMSCFAGLLESYRVGGLPDSAAAIALEDGLIEADSVWTDCGAALFGLLEEKHWP